LNPPSAEKGFQSLNLCTVDQMNEKNELDFVISIARNKRE